MKIQIAMFTGLVLTLGTAMSAVAIHSDRDVKAPVSIAKQAASMQKATIWQATAPASRILVLPRPL